MPSEVVGLLALVLVALLLLGVLASALASQDFANSEQLQEAGSVLAAKEETAGVDPQPGVMMPSSPVNFTVNWQCVNYLEYGATGPSSLCNDITVQNNNTASLTSTVPYTNIWDVYAIQFSVPKGVPYFSFTFNWWFEVQGFVIIIFGAFLKTPNGCTCVSEPLTGFLSGLDTSGSGTATSPLLAGGYTFILAMEPLSGVIVSSHGVARCLSA